jgi:hypothetical protein
MMEEVGILTSIQTAIMANHEPDEKGVCPVWAHQEYVFKHREFKIVKLFERHRFIAMRLSIGFKTGTL